MRTLITGILILLCTSICNAQIAPPKQTDTLVINAVKYNYADIRQENWPCDVIYKSTTAFQIGADEFMIRRIQKISSQIFFFVAGKDSDKLYKLVYEEKHNGEIVIEFSGYEFVCRLKQKPTKDVVSDSEKTSYAVSAYLKGRSVNGNLPTFISDKSGKIVVEIWVDNYGNVQKAVAGVEGTTVTDNGLWEKAKKAALGAHFNMSADAPAMQKGTIVYTLYKNKTVEESVPYQIVDEKPSFRGGDVNQFSKWVNERLVYPDSLKKQGIQGRVTVQFTIHTDGSVRDVSILRGVHPELDKEAVRVVASSPKWNPGRYRGEEIPVAYTFPVIFQAR